MGIFSKLKDQITLTPEELEIGAKAKIQPAKEKSDETFNWEEINSRLNDYESRLKSVEQKLEKLTDKAEVTNTVAEPAVAATETRVNAVDTNFTESNKELERLNRKRKSFLNERKLARDRKDLDAAAECGAKILEIDEKIKALQGGD